MPAARARSATARPLPDADTVFRIASMTKCFTAATILLLRDEGRLRLDDPVRRHVPELAGWAPPTADRGPITIRQLLTMSAGLPTDDPWGDRQQGLPLDRFARLLAAGPTFAWPPGIMFEYSNLGLRDPRPGGDGRRGRRVPRGRARPAARAARHDVHRVPRGGGPGGAPRPRLRPARRHARPRGDRRVRGARVDGRPVHLGPRPRALGGRVHGRVPRPRRSRGPAPAPPRVARARCSRSSARSPGASTPTPRDEPPSCAPAATASGCSSTTTRASARSSATRAATRASGRT